MKNLHQDQKNILIIVYKAVYSMKLSPQKKPLILKRLNRKFSYRHILEKKRAENLYHEIYRGSRSLMICLNMKKHVAVAASYHISAMSVLNSLTLFPQKSKSLSTFN